MTYSATDMTALETMEMLFARMCNCSSTSGRRSNYVKMWDLWHENAAVREVWDFCETARLLVNRFVKRVKEIVVDWFSTLAHRRYGKYDAFIDWECAPIDEAEVFYLLQIRDDATRELIASKVGTSGGVVERLRDEVKEYTKSYEKQVRLVVQRCVRCLDHAQTIRAESAMRAHYIGKYGSDCFKDNDRFNGVEFDLLEADKILSNLPGLWA